MITDYKKAVENIRNELKNYLQNSGLKSLVVGISGGIDSALSAALAADVCRETGTELIGRSITIESNKAEEIARSKAVGNAFCTDFKEVELTKAYQILLPEIAEDHQKTSPDAFDYKIRKGNIKARIRMMYLYDLAGKNKGMVLSTDNYTELLLGFWTLHGDVGDYGMIQNLWKTEVYAMADYLAQAIDSKEKANALKSCIDAVPTDGLGITDSDLDQLGVGSYAEADKILQKLLQKPDNPEIENNPIVKRKRASEFKRNNPYNIPRSDIV